MPKTQKLGFDQIKQAVNNGTYTKDSDHFLSDEFIMIMESPFFTGCIQAGPMYIIEDIRIIFVESGQATLNVNLIDHTISKGDLAVLNYGAVSQPRQVHDDFKVTSIIISPGLLRAIIPDRTPISIFSSTGIAVIPHNDDETNLAHSMLLNIWTLIHNYGFQPQVAYPAIRMYVEFLDMLNVRATHSNHNKDTKSNNTFNTFIKLLNNYSDKHHNIEFYANEMFLSPHYLGALVKQQSGLTAKEWIDRAIITRAKMLLKSTDLQAVQIADRLNFPSPSFFSKFFKRLTGMTPQTYRDS